MSSSHFASRHRKDLSTDMLRTRIAHRKSLSQKENRHKEYERNRHFGLKDSNIPILERRILAPLDETSQDLVPEKANAKPKSAKTVLGDQRKQMLQKYKEEKQLQKLKEQREKAKRGIFKVGLYRPDMPGFLLSLSNAVKAEPKKAVASSVRITRSKTKEQMLQTKIGNGNIQAMQSGQRLTSEKKMLDKEKKAVQLVVPTAVRMTRSATHAANQMTRTVPSTTVRKPVTRATNGNELERKISNKGRPIKKTETKPDKDISFKVDDKENMLDSQTSETDEMDPDRILSKVENLPKTNTAKMKGKNSFAPKDFMFQPLEGLQTYQAAAMIPTRASGFLTPAYTWTPLKAAVIILEELHLKTKMVNLKVEKELVEDYKKSDETEGATKQILAQKCKTPSAEIVQQDSKTAQCPLGSPAVWNKEHILNKNEGAAKNSNCLPIKEVPSPEISEGWLSQSQHDVPYFRNILQSETEKLSLCCSEWDKKLDLDIPDDAKDLIRTTVGQTRLLMKERFKQFEGLVNDCEYKQGEKETTCADLDGFWDMVSFQIDDVNKKFSNLSTLEESGWQHSNTSKKVVRKKVMSNIVSKPKQDDGGRIAARNRLAAVKNAMRERMKQEEHAEAAVAVLPKEIDKIVFDAGFFRIESPVKSFSGLSISSERHSQRLRTPKSVGKAVSQSRAEMNLLRQTVTAENLDPQSTISEHIVNKSLLSNIPENRNSMVEGAPSPRLHDLAEVNHHVDKKNLEMNCLSSERMNLLLLAGEAADNTKKMEDVSDVVEGMELNSPIKIQDISMSSPEKHIPSQSNIPQKEEAKPSWGQSVLFDSKSPITECHLLDSPGLNGSNLFAQMEKRYQEHARHVSFGGNLIAFSPLRPLSGKKQEEF